MTKQEIDKICNQYNIQKYTINSDGSIDVDDDIDLSFLDFTHLPLKFNKVTGKFSCHNCPNLTSLEGSPKEVGEGFDCSTCPKLTSLEGSPKDVGGYFSCSNCPNLESLEGSPKEVGRHFNCNKCTNLTNLEGSPERVGGYFNCYNCPNLKNPYEFRYVLYTGTSKLDSDHAKIDNIINKYKDTTSMYHIAIEELLNLSDKLGFSND